MITILYSAVSIREFSYFALFNVDTENLSMFRMGCGRHS